MTALVAATGQAVAAAGVDGREIEALGVDTTGSTVVPVGDGLEPLDDYYLWCDHRGWREAAAITRTARGRRAGGAPLVRRLVLVRVRLAQALALAAHPPGHCGRASSPPSSIATWWSPCSAASRTRSRCRGASAPWATSGCGTRPGRASGGGLLRRPRPRTGRRPRPARRAGSPGRTASPGRSTPAWADRLGLRPGIPIPFAGLDAHWDAIGAGVRLGDVVNVIGTSTCVMAISERAAPIPGVCGVVPGSIHPSYTGIEAGLSAAGDIFDAIARRAGTTLAELSAAIDGLPLRADRVAPPDLGQRRPERARQPASGRGDVRLERWGTRPPTSCSPPWRGPRSTRGSSSNGWPSTASRSAG